MANYLNKARVAILTISVQAAVALAQYRAVGADGNYASAGAHMTGVTYNPATAGEQAAVDVLGTVPCEAGAAIAADALLEVGASGKLITRTSGKVVGRALTAASGDGAIFTALLIPANT